MPRPIGISILSVLHVLGGLWLIGTLIFFSDALSSGVESVGLSSGGLVAGIAFIGGLALTAGIGMWLGKRWGWWLGAFYLCYSVARNANALLMIPDIAEVHGGTDDELTRAYFKFGGRVITHSLLILYFFKSNVVEYFQVGGVSAWRRLLLLAAATVGLMVLATVIASLTSAGAESP